MAAGVPVVTIGGAAAGGAAATPSVMEPSACPGTASCDGGMDHKKASWQAGGKCETHKDDLSRSHFVGFRG